MFFGALHFTFLWHGDIIFLYGLLGLLLLAFFFRSDRTIKIWTRVIYIVSSVFITLIGVLLLIGERYFPQETSAEVIEPRLNEVLRNGAFMDAIGPRVELWVFGAITGIFLQGGLAFAAFLLGIRLARSKFLSLPMDRAQNAKMIKRGFLLGLPIQLIAAFALVNNEQSAEPSEALYLFCLFVAFISAPLLSMAYVGVIRKLVEDKSHLVAWMKPAGQMSLTVYISQSVITSLIFGPWGLGLFQELETWSVFTLAFLIWLFLVAFSNLWLKRFDQGPLERVLSLLTRSKRTNSEGS